MVIWQPNNALKNRFGWNQFRSAETALPQGFSDTAGDLVPTGKAAADAGNATNGTTAPTPPKIKEE